MLFSKEEIEIYRSMGLMPDWVYYQVNGKSAQENYNEIARRRQRQFYEKLSKEQEKEIEKQVENVIERTLEDLLKDFD